MFTASFYFLGRYRPAYFEGVSLGDVFQQAYRALDHADDRDWFIPRLHQAVSECRRRNCESWSTEHGCRGISIAKREHDAFLDGVTRDMEPYPGLNYSEAVNR